MSDLLNVLVVGLLLGWGVACTNLLVECLMNRGTESDLREAEVGGRDHQVGPQGREQPGPSPPQPPRRRGRQHDPDDARREQGRPEVAAFGAG